MFVVQEDGGNHMKCNHQPCNRQSSESGITDSTAAGWDSTSTNSYTSRSHPNETVSDISTEEVEITGDTNSKMSEGRGRGPRGQQNEQKNSLRRRRLIMQEDEEGEDAGKEDEHGDSNHEDKVEAGGKKDKHEDTAASQQEGASAQELNAGNTGRTHNAGGGEVGAIGGCVFGSQTGGTLMVTWTELRVTRVVSADGTSRYFVAKDGEARRFVSYRYQA